MIFRKCASKSGAMGCFETGKGVKKAVLFILAFVFVLLSLFAFSSCELSYDVDKPDVYVLSYGNKYPYVTINQYIELGDYEFHPYSGFQIGSLKSTANDAADVCRTVELLSKKAGYKCTTETILVRNITERDLGKYDNFQAKLNEINQKMKEKDILIVYYSGHGGNPEELPGLFKHYLVFSNQLVDYDFFRNEVGNVKGTKVIICDSCYSGAVLSYQSGITLTPDVNGNIDIKDEVKLLFNSTIRENASLFMFSASRAYEKSYDGTETSNSEMTGYLLSAMGGGRAKTTLGTIGALKNNQLTLMNIVKYVYDGMEENKAHANVPVTNGRNDDLILFQF